MPIVAPNLDDRRFDELFAQARSLIPRYAPGWTNYNESDPGIALLELFTWLTELTLYRVNQVPELHYVKFLQLLGISTTTPAPARVDLTFSASKPTDDVLVPARTQAAAQGGDGRPVIFELPEGFTVIGATLATLAVDDTIEIRQYVPGDAASGSIPPFGRHAPDDAALLYGFDAPAGMTEKSITMMIYSADARQAIVAQAGALGIAPPADVAHEFWDGSGWSPLAVERDDTRAFTVTGRLVVFGPGSRSIAHSPGPGLPVLHWVRSRKVRGAFERSPELTRVAINTIPAVEGTTVEHEVIGGSNGMPLQGPFVLGAIPVLAAEPVLDVVRSDGTVVGIESVHIEIDEGSGFEAWQEVTDFAGSGPDDQHFTVDRWLGEVRFGDGRRGAIPAANPALPSRNIVARRYRSGGGLRGNVGPSAVATMHSAVPGIKSVINVEAASGGSDGESVAEAKTRAAGELKSKDRAVAAEDFETIARGAPANVARAHAVARLHPAYPSVSVPGAVTVIVVPDAQGQAPHPTRTTLETVCAWLDSRRLLTTEVFAIGPRYRQVKIDVDVVVKSGSDLAATHDGIVDALTTWLHPLEGGAEGTGWPFGGTIYASDLLRIVFTAPGVERIRDNQLLVELDGDRQPLCRDVDLRPGELIEALAPLVRVGYR